LQKWGPGRVLLWVCIVSFFVRGAGLFAFDGYLDAWSRGAIFITRLPEFVFGICLASWLFSQPDATKKYLSSFRSFLVATIVYLVGLALSLTLPGMTIAPFLLGIGGFVLLYQLFTFFSFSPPKLFRLSGEWIGEHSYSLYLVHHPVILALVPFGLTASLSTSIRILLAMVTTLFLAVILEWAVEWVTKAVRTLVDKRGTVRAFFTVGGLGGMFIVLMISGELLVRRFAPQEVNGWGERPALELDAELGWKLIAFVG
jgi:peptidoglycan/LPS O-acetylase OafA/YrhL